MLPIHEVLPDVKAALAANACVMLVAPPGAGKTTVTPLALLDQAWVAGRKILLLEPRRLAARAAAARMAATLRESVGQTVGLRVRLQSKVGPATRIEVVTEGVFTRMILDDPALDGVAAVLFDEFHERSLDADLGLALARESQGALREDLRLLVMSATLDDTRLAAMLEAPVVRSEGRAFPVETRYLGRDDRLRLEERAVRAVRQALAEEAGGVLVFLPGQAEIRRAEALLKERLPAGVRVAPLYGALDLAEQDRAVAPAAAGERKVVLATSIAETSLTLEGVRVVVDAGLARVPRYDPASGLTRLVTVRVSRAAADQRRGRAGRTEPGVCYRLWDEAETKGLSPFARPEILESDLSGLALDLARWGARDAQGLGFLDPPPAGAFAEARGLLARLEALDGEGSLTAHGKALAQLPLAPRLAHMLVAAAARGQAQRAALIAALLSEPGLGGRDTDLRSRLGAMERDGSPRARDARTLAGRWAQAVKAAPSLAPAEDGLLLATAFPERIAKARGKPGEFQLANGRGAWMDPADPLAREPWLAIAELGGGEARDRILLAAPLDAQTLESEFAHQIGIEERLSTDAKGRLKAVRLRRLGKLTLSEVVLDRVDPEIIVAALLNQVRDEGLGAVPFGDASRALRARARFLGWPDLQDEALLASLDDWLAPLLAGRSAVGQLGDHALAEALRQRLPWERQQALDRLAPARFSAPTGSTFAIDYAAEGGPRVEVRVGELYGLRQHPTIGGRPLTLALLSPAHRPIQVTKDLPGFWAGSWKAVRTEMKGRYPRHLWPEDPAVADPTTRAKPRGT
jgi:ATP-dependent helicase HrpB